MIPDRIPLSIVTGFLGSGKTTLIAALLKQPDMDNVAVIVNEFGAVGVDNAIFARPIELARIAIAAVGESWEEVERELGAAFPAKAFLKAKRQLLSG